MWEQLEATDLAGEVMAAAEVASTTTLHHLTPIINHRRSDLTDRHPLDMGKQAGVSHGDLASGLEQGLALQQDMPSVTEDAIRIVAAYLVVDLPLQIQEGYLAD